MGGGDLGSIDYSPFVNRCPFFCQFPVVATSSLLPLLPSPSNIPTRYRHQEHHTPRRHHHYSWFKLWGLEAYLAIFKPF